MVQPAGWAPPRGYVNGMAGRGRETLFVAGQIGWDAQCKLVSQEFLPQFDQALANVVAAEVTASGVVVRWPSGTTSPTARKSQITRD